jgi:hypothetical protein
MGKTDNVIPFPKGGVAGLEPAVLIQLVEGVSLSMRGVSVCLIAAKHYGTCCTSPGVLQE